MTPSAMREGERGDGGDRGDRGGHEGGLEGCCPFQEAIDLLSKRHAMTIIWLLQQEEEPRRFNQIKRAIDINPVTLTQRLNELEQAGILRRRTFNETPPRVEYSLTSKGRDLVPLMDQLSKWARKHPVEAVAAT